VRAKYTVKAERVREMIAEEEEGIVRSAQEKAAIAGSSSSAEGSSQAPAADMSAPLI